MRHQQIYYINSIRQIWPWDSPEHSAVLMFWLLIFSDMRTGQHLSDQMNHLASSSKRNRGQLGNQGARVVTTTKANIARIIPFENSLNAIRMSVHCKRYQQMSSFCLHTSRRQQWKNKIRPLWDTEYSYLLPCSLAHRCNIYLSHIWNPRLRRVQW